MPTTGIDSTRLAALQAQVWRGSLPLQIRLAPSDCRSYDQSDPYLIQYPRLSYLAFLLPRLHAFFAPSLINPEVAPHDAWLEFEGVPLKWHYPVGLLYDLFARAEPVTGQRFDDRADGEGGSGEADRDGPIPWSLTIHYTDFPVEQLIALESDGRAMRDWYVNAVKEADFVRNGSGRPVMGLSKGDSDNLWEAVQTHDISLFNSVNIKLLNPPGFEIRHIPIKIYLPFTSAESGSAAPSTIAEETNETTAASAGHFRIVQTLTSVQQTSTRTPQTLGTALNGVLPSVFPSRRNPLLAQPVLHGAVVPMNAVLEELGRACSYTDGFLHVVVVMFG